MVFDLNLNLNHIRFLKYWQMRLYDLQNNYFSNRKMTFGRADMITYQISSWKIFYEDFFFLKYKKKREGYLMNPIEMLDCLWLTYGLTDLKTRSLRCSISGDFFLKKNWQLYFPINLFRQRFLFIEFIRNWVDWIFLNMNRCLWFDDIR